MLCNEKDLLIALENDTVVSLNKSDLPSLRVVNKIVLCNYLVQLQTTADKLIVCYYNSVVDIYDIHTFQLLKSLGTEIRGSRGVTYGIQWSATILLSLVYSNRVVTRITVSNDSEKLLIWNTDSRLVRIYDLSTFEEVNSLTFSRVPRGMCCVDGKVFATMKAGSSHTVDYVEVWLY